MVQVARVDAKLAVAVTDSDRVPSFALWAEYFGFTIDTLRFPSAAALVQKLPDLILIDWSPSSIERNTALVDEVRNTRAIEYVPIFVFYSSKDDVPTAVWRQPGVVAFQVGVSPEVFERALVQFVSGWTPNIAPLTADTPPGRVFVGHGRSPIWRDLKEFLEERLGLAVVEFNRQSAAGMSTTERLTQMLSEASFAFLVFTAEDQSQDGTMHARENVVHEAGLFQGRLGFKRAIILLEEECREFSNIVGLGQIRFPAGSIVNAYEEIRRVLEREKIIRSS